MTIWDFSHYRQAKFPLCANKGHLWDSSHMEIGQLQRLINERLSLTGLSARRASLLSIGRPDFVRDIKNGSMPGFDKVCRLLDTLGLRVQITPEQGPRSGLTRETDPSAMHPASVSRGRVSQNSEVRERPGSWEDHPARPRFGSHAGEVDVRHRDRERAELLARLVVAWEVLDPEQRRRLAGAIDANLELIAPSAANAGELEEISALDDPSILTIARDFPASQCVPVFGMEVAAGAGELANEPAPVEGCLALDGKWLDLRRLELSRCMVVGVRGESMEPTLPAGALTLVDQASRNRREGRVYVVRSDPDDTLMVARAGRDRGRWVFLNDNPDPEWPPAPWPDAGAEVLGEVVWVSGMPVAA